MKCSIPVVIIQTLFLDEDNWRNEYPEDESHSSENGSSESKIGLLPFPYEYLSCYMTLFQILY